MWRYLQACCPPCCSISERGSGGRGGWSGDGGWGSYGERSSGVGCSSGDVWGGCGAWRSVWVGQGQRWWVGTANCEVAGQRGNACLRPCIALRLQRQQVLESTMSARAASGCGVVQRSCQRHQGGGRYGGAGQTRFHVWCSSVAAPFKQWYVTTRGVQTSWRGVTVVCRCLASHHALLKRGAVVAVYTLFLPHPAAPKAALSVGCKSKCVLGAAARKTRTGTLHVACMACTVTKDVSWLANYVS